MRQATPSARSGDLADAIRARARQLQRVKLRKPPLAARLSRSAIIRRSLSPAGAVRAIAATTLLVTLVSGALITFVDHDEFPTLGRGWWWAIQTVTTVGYGDVVPKAAAGRVVAVFVMLSGLAFLTVVTAAISARLVAGERRTAARADERRLEEQLAEISERLERLDAALRGRRAA
jgi:voltage-gated potassium channel